MGLLSWLIVRILGLGLFGLLFILNALCLKEFSLILLNPSLINRFGAVSNAVAKFFTVPTGQSEDSPGCITVLSRVLQGAGVSKVHLEQGRAMCFL